MSFIQFGWACLLSLVHNFKITAMSVSNKHLPPFITNSFLSNYNGGTTENNKMSKKGIKLISWLIRRWLRHGDNGERLCTSESHTAARNTYSISALISKLVLCIVVMTTLGQWWSGFKWLWDNRRRWQREWRKMVSERGSHRSGGRWCWEKLWISPKEIFSIGLEENCIQSVITFCV